jgi:hypothetical protein
LAVGRQPVLLDWSLDKGVYEGTVQWDTFCQTMSAVTNMSQACVGGLEIGRYFQGIQKKYGMFITGVTVFLLQVRLIHALCIKIHLRNFPDIAEEEDC